MKSFLYLLFFLLMSPGLLQAENIGMESFVIKGHISGLKDNTLVFLKDINGLTVAQDLSKGEKFELRGEAKTADIYDLGFIGYTPRTSDINLYIKEGEIDVSGNVKHINLSNVSSTDANTNTFALFEKKFEPLHATLNAIVERIKNSKTAEEKNASIADLQRIRNEVSKDVITFVDEHNNSEVSAFVLYATYPLVGSLDLLKNSYAKLSITAKATMFGEALESLISDETLKLSKKQDDGLSSLPIGSTAPNFTQNSADDKTITLSDFKGKYVLLDFWASWCGPCRRENPNVVKAYKKFKDKNFVIIGVSLDQDKSKWLQAIKEDHLSWIQVSDLHFWNSAVAKLYDISLIPQNFLINPQGIIVAKDLRGDLLEQTLNTMLK